MIKKLQDMNIAIAFPLKIAVFTNGKKAMTTNKNKAACGINFDIISTGVVNR
jgi:hypothetical protein